MYALKRNAQDAENELDINRILGRKVKNLSHSKYKFVNGNVRLMPSVRRKRACLVPQKSLLKIDRRASSEKRASCRRRWRQNLSLSTEWKRRRSRSTVFSVNRRISFGNSIPTPDGKEKQAASSDSVPLWRGSATTLAAQRIVSQWRWRWSAADQRKKAAAQARTYCMFFNRFGRCSRGDKCQYVHDPEKVSVCTRFLRGTCKVTDCPFSHHVAPDKMPTCRYFLRGICSHDNCPYRHVRVASNAGPCLDFARGFCHLGDACKKNHVLICPEFTESGVCSRGKRCPLRHNKKSEGAKAGVKRSRPGSSGGVKDTTKDGVKMSIMPDQASKTDDTKMTEKQKLTNIDGDAANDDGDVDDITLPMKHRHLPSFIAIDMSEKTPEKPVKDAAPVKSSAPVPTLSIRPRLAPLPLVTGSNSGDAGTDLSWLRDL
jgi:hypothetical protein